MSRGVCNAYPAPRNPDPGRAGRSRPEHIKELVAALDAAGYVHERVQ
jgi:hypothetical protein